MRFSDRQAAPASTNYIKTSFKQVNILSNLFRKFELNLIYFSESDDSDEGYWIVFDNSFHPISYLYYARH